MKFYEVEHYVPVGLDIMCLICCHWGHRTSGCSNLERVYCAICTEPHLTTAHKCPIIVLKQQLVNSVFYMEIENVQIVLETLLNAQQNAPTINEQSQS